MVPAELGAGGSALWAEVTGAHTLDAVQGVQLLEACRAKDRLDVLAGVLAGGDDSRVWASALRAANGTAQSMKQLLAALRLPDSLGERPQHRGVDRGAYVPSGRARRVGSSRDRMKVVPGSVG